MKLIFFVFFQFSILIYRNYLIIHIYINHKNQRIEKIINIPVTEIYANILIKQENKEILQAGI